MHPSIQIEDTSHHVYLADFGLSQLMVDTRTLGTQTCQQGTPSFQSHEQLTAMDVGTEADIYAFGCLAVELFGRKPVWEGLHPYQIITKVVVDREKPNIGHLDPKLHPLCKACLSDSNDRISACEALQIVLNFV